MMRGLLKGQSVEVVRVTASYVDGERVESTERETVQDAVSYTHLTLPTNSRV